MMPSPVSIVYLAVLAQACVISFICASRWVQTQLDLFKQYPPSAYPHFYVFSLQTEIVHIIVRIMLDIISIMLIGVGVYLDYAHQMSFYSFWVICTAIQLTPSLYSLLVLQLASKRRAKIITRQSKSVSIVHRSVFDHLSISYLFLLVLSILLTLNIIFSNDQLALIKKLGLAGLFVATNGLLFWQIYKAIYGKSADKLINQDDKTEKRRQDVQRSFIGIAASVVIFSLLGLHTADTAVQGVWLILPLSLFVQMAVYHRSKRWHADDMAVYQ
ncbi:hypothetical protein [Alteromonas facilis]|uniref:hypothetical protein n=1 Tax=Alteromonas facilis TaxID=2048004 RepID=UPI000C28229B|nr:hypothetical protein [Alteromonas facilis]